MRKYLIGAVAGAMIALPAVALAGPIPGSPPVPGPVTQPGTLCEHPGGGGHYSPGRVVAEAAYEAFNNYRVGLPPFGTLNGLVREQWEAAAENAIWVACGN